MFSRVVVTVSTVKQGSPVPTFTESNKSLECGLCICGLYICTGEFLFNAINPLTCQLSLIPVINSKDMYKRKVWKRMCPFFPVFPHSPHSNIPVNVLVL